MATGKSSAYSAHWHFLANITWDTHRHIQSSSQWEGKTSLLRPCDQVTQVLSRPHQFSNSGPLWTSSPCGGECIRQPRTGERKVPTVRTEFFNFLCRTLDQWTCEGGEFRRGFGGSRVAAIIFPPRIREDLHGYLPPQFIKLPRGCGDAYCVDGECFDWRASSQMDNDLLSTNTAVHFYFWYRMCATSVLQTAIAGLQHKFPVQVTSFEDGLFQASLELSGPARKAADTIDRVVKHLSHFVEADPGQSACSPRVDCTSPRVRDATEPVRFAWEFGGGGRCIREYAVSSSMNAEWTPVRHTNSDFFYVHEKVVLLTAPLSLNSMRCFDMDDKELWRFKGKFPHPQFLSVVVAHYLFSYQLKCCECPRQSCRLKSCRHHPLSTIPMSMTTTTTPKSTMTTMMTMSSLPSTMTTSEATSSRHR